MRATPLVLATALVAVACVGLSAPAAADGCEITETIRIPEFLIGQERCIENAPPDGHLLCWGP